MKTEFCADTLHDFVVAHGFGAPTELGYEKGAEYCAEGLDYAEAAAEVTAMGWTTEAESE